jgi:hypothetical protein
MTIYGTPGGTPLNTTGFQGTQPGNAVGATLPGLPQQPGLFPPNSNNQGGGSALDAMSRGTLPANTYVNNEGVGNSISLSTALSTGTDGGNQSSPTNGVPFGSAVGGGNGAVGGVGGANMNSNVGAVGDVALAAQAPAVNVTYQGGAVPSQFAG